VTDFARTEFELGPEHSAGSVVTVRTAVTDGDHQAAFDLLVAGYGRYQWIMPSAALVIRSSDMFQIELRFRQGGVLLADVGGRIVGAALCHFNPHDEDPAWPRRWASLRAAAMAPSDASFTLGRALVDGCAAAARARGLAALCLHLAEMSGRGRDAQALGLVRAPSLDFAADTPPAPDYGWPVRAYVLSLE
jgi:hypothetical protein